MRDFLVLWIAGSVISALGIASFAISYWVFRDVFHANQAWAAGAAIASSAWALAYRKELEA